MMKKITNSPHFSTFLHVLVWGSLLLLTFFGSYHNTGPFSSNYWLVSNLLQVGIFYFNAYYLYPKLMNKRLWWLYLLALPVLIYGSFLVKLGMLRIFEPDLQMKGFYYGLLFFPSILFVVASIIYRLIVDNIRHEKRKKEQQAEQLAIELKFLRSQISPHFLFNVLTNLVSLARKKSDLMEPSLIMLSDLMRYMLYDSEGKKVPLVKEVQYLKSYIELQKLRFGDDARIETDIRITDEEAQHGIEPMLLIPFVENAFKHGIGWIEDPWILIRLEVTEGRLTFTVKNKFSDNGKDSKDGNSGIGLANVSSRLKLLYPAQHILSIQKEGNVFATVLTLHLQ